MKHVRIDRITGFLDSTFDGLVDMSDRQKSTPEDQRAHFLSRAVAATCIKFLANVEARVAADSVTDGYHDGGIDALHIDPASDTMFFVQSSYSVQGKSTIDVDTTAKFTDGVCDILAGRFERFNDKFARRKHEILPALYRPGKIRIVTVHSSAQPISQQAQQKIQDLVDQLNGAGDPTAKAEYFTEDTLYEKVFSDLGNVNIDLGIHLQEWGLVQKPLEGYYGRVHVSVIAEWWHEHGNRLCSRNIRHLLPSSEVNSVLQHTLTAEAEHFWYFNNGITIVCDSIEVSRTGRPGRELGYFKCKGASIVNGAQTVGTIGNTIPDPKAAENSLQSWVQVRIISLKGAAAGFEKKIARATNFQNAVRGRDFAAMDPVQQRLATEFALDRRTYAYKSGDPEPQGEQGCSIVEAAQALACDRPTVGLVVDVKREIGAIWADIDGPPYKELFNDSLTSQRVWRSVRVMRTVDAALLELRATGIPRADLIGVHMNRIILHLVFRNIDVRRLNHDGGNLDDLLPLVSRATHDIFPAVAAYLDTEHLNEYLGSLCKNHNKCADLVDAVTKLRAGADKGQVAFEF